MKRLVVALGVLAFASTALAQDPIIWDNQAVELNGLAASQNDTAYPFAAIVADDFELTDPDTIVTDVHWIGGYWAGPPDDGNFDWEVTFYADNGAGTAPGATILSQLYPNAEVNETLISGTPGGTNWFSYDVDLPDPLPLVAGEKYWISIQGMGNYPPQSGWAYDLDPIVLHEAVFKSAFFGYPDWTDGTTVFGNPINMHFQLTGVPEPASLLLLGLGVLALRRR
jgi:hypothetical protein